MVMQQRVGTVRRPLLVGIQGGRTNNTGSFYLTRGEVGGLLAFGPKSRGAN
jgi:hypothetical protein